MRIAEDQGVQEVLAFATSAIREAPNGEAVLAAIRASTGAPLQVLSGQDEARLTFLAVRRWFGWSSGHLLALDIGGGSLEIAAGIDEVPDAALSLPLGAGRLTREHLPGRPAERRRTSGRCAATCGSRSAPWCASVVKTGTPDRVVGTSKTLRSLARVAGAAPSSDGPYAARELRADDVAALVDRLAGMTDGRAPGAARRLARAGGPAAGRRAGRRRGDGPARRRATWTSAPGPCARASSCAGWTPGRRSSAAGRVGLDRPAPRLVAWPSSRSPSDGVVRVTPAKVSLSTASAYPLNCATTFEIAARLGYDGVEVMVWTDPVSQDPDALRALSEHHGLPIVVAARADPADHPAGLGHRPVAQAADLVRGRRGRRAPGPLWCTRRSAGSASTRAASRSGWPSWRPSSGCQVAVENMFPWRARGRELMAYLPHWDPVGQPYEHVTLDVSHTATAGVDAARDGRGAGRPAGAPAPGRRLGQREGRAPGARAAGRQPCAELLERLAAKGWAGNVVVEVSTRRAVDLAEREADLAEALAFARLNLVAAAR